MKLPSWFKRTAADASPPALDEVRARLAQARADADAADRAVQDARAKLDADRTPAALEGLRAAKADAEDASELVRIAEADVRRTEADVREAELVRLRARRDELRAATTRDACKSAGTELAQREAELWIRLADVRAQRAALAATHHEMVVELRRILTALGEAVPDGVYLDSDGKAWVGGGLADHSGLISSAESVAEHVQLSPDDPRRKVLCELGLLR